MGVCCEGAEVTGNRRNNSAVSAMAADQSLLVGERFDALRCLLLTPQSISMPAAGMQPAYAYSQQDLPVHVPSQHLPRQVGSAAAH